MSSLCMYIPRALEFICVFLESVVGGEEDLVKCANKAYDESLRKYHGWIVRGIFNVSLFSYIPLLINLGTHLLDHLERYCTNFKGTK